MNRFPVVSTAIMIVAFVVSIIISRDMLQVREQLMYGDVKAERMNMTYFPVLGVDKFYADIEWIRLIQQMGDHETKMKDDEDGHNAAKFFYKQLDRITNLSPDTDKIYMVGSGHIAHLEPQLAVKLLGKAERVSTNDNWKRLQYAAFVQDRFIADRTEDAEKKREAIEAAAEYLRKALDMGGAPEYVESAWLRKRAMLRGVDNDPLGRLILEYDYYVEKTQLGKIGEEEGLMDETDRSEGLRERLMEQAQKLAMEYWQKLRGASGAEKKTLQESYAQVKKIFFDVAPEGHYSTVSLRPYGKGIFYDVYTGTPVEPYGISWPAYNKLGKIVVVSGAYCPLTGEPVNEGKPAKFQHNKLAPARKPAPMTE